MALGRALSLIVVLGAVIGQLPYTTLWQHSKCNLSVKLPQIIKIVRASSVENLSYLAIIQELAAVTFTGAYSFAKSFPFRC